MGNATGQINTDDGVVTDIAAPAGTTIHSSLKLIDASATTGGVQIGAGATNTSGAGNFIDGESLNADVTITYTGLTIKGGSGTDSIENDAKKGIVIDGNGNRISSFWAEPTSRPLWAAVPAIMLMSVLALLGLLKHLVPPWAIR